MQGIVNMRARLAILVFVYLFIANLVIVKGSVGGRKRRALQSFSGDEAYQGSNELGLDEAAKFMIRCGKELKLFEPTELYQSFDIREYFGGPKDKKLYALTLKATHVHEAIRRLTPREKDTLLTCLRRKKKNIRHKIRASRRDALYDPLQGPISLKNTSPAPAPSPKRKPPGSPPNLASPISNPSQAPSPTPRKQGGSAQPDQSGYQGISYSERNLTIGMMFSAALATIILLSLLVLCCLALRKRKLDESDGIKDEKPLVNIYINNSQSDTIKKSHIFRNPSSKKKLRINREKISSFGGKNMTVVVDLKNPDGKQSHVLLENMDSDSPNALQPLKPPPGKETIIPPPAPPLPKPAPTPPPAPATKAPAPPPPKPAHPLPPANLKPPPLPPHHREKSADDSEAPKAKLKPFFWDKVLASPDHAMVWHEIKAGSFQFNEEMIESLFGYASADKNKKDRRKESAFDNSPQYIQIINSQKSQNLSILLRALNLTTEEVCDALQEGNELPAELIQTLLKMAPTTDEELKLRLYDGDLNQLGPAERFLKDLVEIPFAFKRLESILFMSSLQEEVSNTRESHRTLEVACNQLKSSRLFLKLLEAVLKTGNRMNDGTYRGGAQAFKLDTLLKLSDVKGTDGKTTLLHFVVQEIIRSEGIRAARAARESHISSSFKSEDYVDEFSEDSEKYYRSLGLQVVSGLADELQDVKKAAIIDADGPTTAVNNLERSLKKAKDFLNNEMKSLNEDSEFQRTLVSFVEHAETDIPSLVDEDNRIMAVVQSTAEYFHGNAVKDEGLRLFTIVRDLLIMLEKVCKEVKESLAIAAKTKRKETPSVPCSPDTHKKQLADVRQRLFPVIRSNRNSYSSSDSDDEN